MSPSVAAWVFGVVVALILFGPATVGIVRCELHHWRVKRHKKRRVS